MLKGCQRKIIVLKNTGSAIFEEAYFVIKESAAKAHISEYDMIAEANRILSDCGIETAPRAGRKRGILKSCPAAVWTISAIAALILAISFLVRSF